MTALSSSTACWSRAATGPCDRPEADSSTSPMPNKRWTTRATTSIRSPWPAAAESDAASEGTAWAGWRALAIGGPAAHVAMARRPRSRADQDRRRTPAAGLTGPAATTTGFAGHCRNRPAGIFRCPVYRRRPPPRAGATAALGPATRPRRASHTLARPPRVPQKAAPTADLPPRPNHRRRVPATQAAASRARWPAHPRPESDLPGCGESIRPQRACQGSFRRRAGRSAGRNRRTGCENGAQSAQNGWPIFVSWRREMESPWAGAKECCRRGLRSAACLKLSQDLSRG